MSTSDSIHLIVCDSIEEYERVAHDLRSDAEPFLAIPIFRPAPPRFRGFPSEAKVIGFREWFGNETPASRPLEGRSCDDRLCLCADDPICVAVGRYVARRQNKTLWTCHDPTILPRQLETLLDAGNVQSLTFVVPSWHLQSREADPGWLYRILNAMRALPEMADRLSWGIMTATEPGTLSRVAAKAVLQAPIIAAYQDAPAVLFATYDATHERSSLPLLAEGARDFPLQLADRHHVAERSEGTLVDRPWSALIFKSHGRSYCASDGYLCGARRLVEDPLLPVSECVLGLQCADPRYPQIDPRRYDAPVVVMDGCGTGSWASPVWETGIPSLAFFALAGSPGAVVTGDGVTMNPSGNYLDVLYALASSATLGEAVTRLNELRRANNTRFPFFLLGDPDTPAGPTRWPHWSSQASVACCPTNTNDPTRFVLSRPDQPAVFLRVRLPHRTDEGAVLTRTLYVNPLEGGGDLKECRAYPDRDGTELWLGIGLRGSTTQVLVEERLTPTFPPGLLKAAEEVARQAESWASPLVGSKPRLLKAADRILKVAQVLNRHKGAAVAGAADDYANLVPIAVKEWMAAQAACVRAAVELAPGGLWPFRLWAAQGFQAELVDEPSPDHGIRPTIRRTYQSPPGVPRCQRECMRADLIEDRPDVPGFPQVSLQVPARIHFSEPATVTLTLDHRAEDTFVLGGGAVLLDGKGHGILASPEVFPISVGPGEQMTIEVQLTPTEIPIAHLYRVRALLLLNGQWYLASRHVVVSR